MKLIPRSSDQDHLVQDKNVEVVSSLYIPYSGNSAPSIGGNDEDKMGAISMGTTGGISFIDVYQGGGEWKRILYSTSGPSITDLEFSGTDVQDPTGNSYLILSLTGTQRPFSVTVNGDVISGFSYQRTVDGNLYGIAKTGGGSWVSGDVIMVAIVGIEGDPFDSSLSLQNNSSQDSIYGIGESEGTLLSGQIYNSPVSEELSGASIYVTISNGQTCVYTVYNSDNSIYFTHTLVGPGTENGLPIANNQLQEFIISNT